MYGASSNSQAYLGRGVTNERPGAPSRHPVDQLIRELIDSRRAATPDEVARIVERMAVAPFDPEIVPVRLKDRGIVYQQRALTNRASSLFYHLVKRVIVEQQWSEGTTESDYLHDIRDAIRNQPARLVVYRRHGGAVAAVCAPNTVVALRRGPEEHPWIFVIYSADRGVIVSGYQVSSLNTVSIPEDRQWLL